MSIRLPSLAWQTRRNVLFAANVGPLTNIPHDPDIRTREASLDDLDELVCMAQPADSPYFAKRLEAGEACLVAEAGGAIVGYIWIQTLGHFDGWLNLAIDQSDGAAACVVYNAYTMPEYRKRGVRTLLLVEERRWCRDNGRTRIIFWLDSRVAERALLRWQDYSLEAEMLGELVTQVCLGVVPFSYWRGTSGGPTARLSSSPRPGRPARLELAAERLTRRSPLQRWRRRTAIRLSAQTS